MFLYWNHVQFISGDDCHNKRAISFQGRWIVLMISARKIAFDAGVRIFKDLKPPDLVISSEITRANILLVN